ncbi:MAG: helix-turn-helix domain-containing protein [Saccharofermentanales bacterium]|jgi:hypothetical protein|nr:helix-turn-helix transcriptional regulator [Bacillota bacterium]
MIFSEILSILLNLSNTSIREFADAVLYDRSYISKWVNDKALPSASNWQETKTNMLNFFDANLSASDMQYLATQYPYFRAIVQSNKEWSNRELLATLLERGYNRTLNRDEMQRQEKEKDFASTFIGTQDVVNYLINYLTQHITHGSKSFSTFYYMGNIVRCFSDDLLDNIYINYMSPNSLKVKFTVNMDLLSSDYYKGLAFMNAYLRLISALPFLNLEIYKAAQSSADVVSMAQRGGMAGWGFNIIDGVPDVLFVSEDEETIDEGYLSLRMFFEMNQPLLSLQKNCEDIFVDMGDDPSARTPILYTPRMYLYYGSDELREQMFEDRFINIKEYELWGKLRKVLSGLVTRQTKIIVTKTALNDTFARGWIYKTNGSNQIYGDHYKKYTEDVFTMFQRQNLIILDNEKISNVRRLPTAIVYSDQATAFVLHFNQMTPYETQNIMSKSNDQAFISLIYAWLEAVMRIEDKNFLQ